MKVIIVLALAVAMLVTTTCDSSIPTLGATATPTPVPTSIFVPTPPPTVTAVPIPAADPTPDFSPPDVYYILDSAIENLRTIHSFHVEARIVGGSQGRRTFIAADIVNPDAGYIYESWTDYVHGEQDEMLTIGQEHYYRPAGFQVWFDAGDRPHLQRDILGFPYKIELFRTGIGNLELQGIVVMEGVDTYLLTGIASRGLAAGIGFYSADTWSRGIVEVEMFISRDDLLPIRFVGGIDGFQASFSAGYSNFGIDLGVSTPDEIWDFDFLQRSWEGALTAEEMGQMLQVVPVEGQKCMEVDIGTGLYLKVISGDNVGEDIMRAAYRFCEGALFSVSGDLITSRTDQIGAIVAKWDLGVLSISPEELEEQGLQCFRMSIGLSSLFEIGNGHRPPTSEEVEAVERCKTKAGEEEDS